MLADIFRLWLHPEIDRRKHAGTLPANFDLRSAQILWPNDGRTIIRLNDEIRGRITLRTTQTVSMIGGSLPSDLDDYEYFDLIEAELDAGHITIIRNSSDWFIEFNALRGRATGARLVELSHEFIVMAEYAKAQGYYGPCIDALFSAYELLSKVHLILHMSPAAKSKRHGSISSAINSWGRLGNVSGDFVRIFNWLSERRGQARYDALSPAQETIGAEIFSVARSEVGRLRQTVAPATERPDIPKGEHKS